MSGTYGFVDATSYGKLGKFENGCLEILGSVNEKWRITAISETIFRVTFHPEGIPRIERTWSICGNGGVEDVPQSGRYKDDMCRFNLPNVEVFSFPSDEACSLVVFRTERLECRCNISSSSSNSKTTIYLEWIDRLHSKRFAEDIPRGAYSYQRLKDGVVQHRMRVPRRSRIGGGAEGEISESLTFHSATEHIYGLGDSGGNIDKFGRSCCIGAMDAMGYDPTPQGASSPLYKQWPAFLAVVPSGGTDISDVDKEMPHTTWLHKGTAPTPATVSFITKKSLNDAHLRSKSSSITYAMIYDTGSRGTIDCGSEISAFRGLCRTARFECGDIDYYMVLGNNPMECTEQITDLIGRPASAPKWALGYLASSMSYADSNNISESMNNFMKKAHQHDVDPAGLFLSSGYTCLDSGERCVFNWSGTRVPGGAAQFFQQLREYNLKCIPNTKPWLLHCHPLYKELEQLNGYVRRYHNSNSGVSSHAEPEVSLLWSGGAGTSDTGSYVDFFSDNGFNWWKRKLTEQLLVPGGGASGIWVDNNEYEVDDGASLCGNIDESIPIALLRPFQALLMARASLEALQQDRPHTRQLVVTRAGGIGTHRYAMTWSGDNWTSWDHLQHNTAQGCSLGILGWSGNAHDIGGFAGPAPCPELLSRWCQSQALAARFTIHSWNSDGSGATEPWMHNCASLPTVHAALASRTYYLPYLHTLQMNSSRVPKGMGGVDMKVLLSECDRRANDTLSPGTGESEYVFCLEELAYTFLDLVVGLAGSPIIRPLFYEHFHDPNTLSSQNELHFTMASYAVEGQRSKGMDGTKIAYDSASAVNQNQPFTSVCYQDLTIELQHAASCDFKVGSCLMVAPIYRPNMQARDVYLPKVSSYNNELFGSEKEDIVSVDSWCNIASGRWCRDNHIVRDVEAPMHTGLPPTFAQVGSAIPTFAPSFAGVFRNFDLYPGSIHGSMCVGVSLEDETDYVMSKGKLQGLLVVVVAQVDSSNADISVKAFGILLSSYSYSSGTDDKPMVISVTLPENDNRTLNRFSSTKLSSAYPLMHGNRYVDLIPLIMLK